MTVEAILGLNAQDAGLIPVVACCWIACWWASRWPHAMRRIGAYVLSVVTLATAAAVVAGWLMQAQCPVGNDCDLTPVVATVWAGITAFAMVVSAAMNEMRVYIRGRGNAAPIEDDPTL